MNRIARILVAIAGGLFVLSAAAQDSFDLSSQRKEKKSWHDVPGYVVDHHGLAVNPVPRHMSVDSLVAVNIGDGLMPMGEAKSYGPELSALGIKTSGKGLPLYIGKVPVSAKPGAYKLELDAGAAHISAADDQGVFYALQTLRQLLQGEAASDGIVPAVVISDEPEFRYRGIVEGFYGDPWSHQVRMSLIEFLGRNKMNTYVFGPKDDPYHSSPNWRKPYPQVEAERISELVEACRSNRVDFVWAIHPGKDIRWDEDDYQNLLNKFNLMYDLGVRAFAIFFDDIEGAGTNPVRQAELLNRINREFVKVKGDVANLTVCPTDYSRLWASPRPHGNLATYGNILDSDIEVFYTGDFVCSDLTHDTMNFFNTLVKRPGYYWWNYPVSDYCRNFLLQGPVYGLEPTMTSSELAGILSNPMQHGEASKLALYSVGDYAWNPLAYNPIDSWNRALAELMPEATDAYRTFAIHSADTQTGYRRAESWNITPFVYPDYTPEQLQALKAEFLRIVEAPVKIRESCDNKQLLSELEPWLVEFGKLGRRCLNVVDLIEKSDKLTDAEFDALYQANLMTPADTTAYSAHKIGTMKLQPFYELNMEALKSRR